ncbi:MAG: carbamate kinase [Planctomycetota bacterium]
MTERTILVLGGNAFALPGQPLTMARQFEFARQAFEALSPLLLQDRELIISHGNGPQVGHMLIRVEEALGKAYAVPLEVCVAESEGELGYVITQTLHNILEKSGRQRAIASMLTQVIVDSNDPAFSKPTKPIGPFYTSEQAKEVSQRGFPLHEEAGRGFRRVVPSPRPREIMDVGVINTLLQAGVLVVAAGGGGIPVIRAGNQLRGVEAVVDKDLTSALLGELTDARLMLILTDVPCAYRDYNTPDQSPIGRIGITEAQKLIDEGHFAEGSMKPKIEAAIQFSRRPDSRTIICNVDVLDQALIGLAGTIIAEAESKE